ncbi:tetratricopeptide repeat protein [Streptomyces sp. NPDC090045]|uniref:tetratricopeptide repeat protein n=1 Tax=Streptomyces sp. NPDC090045 TaxID=3365927 RepID=UPI003807AA57
MSAQDEVRQEASGRYIAQAAPGGTAMVVSYQYVPPQPVAEETLVAAAWKLAELPLGKVPPRGALPAGSRVALGPNPLFVGRMDDLRTLAAGFAGSSRVLAVAGLAGVGKTQLAAEFVHRYGPYFAGGVFWLTFADPDAVPGEIAACGGPGGLELRPDYSTLNFEDQVRLVLAAWQSGLPRLLIFDNCEDEALLARWRPPTGGCRVLVTTRREVWDPHLGVDVLNVDVLQRPESVELLRRYRADLLANDDTLDAVAAELGDLPLALHMAGSFLARYSEVLTPTAYLTQLRRTGPLSHGSLQKAGISPTGHAQNVSRTFALSYDRLDPATAVDALALALLERIACLVPGENTPRLLLYRSAGVDLGDTDALLMAEDALHRLVELGLLQTQSAGARLHRLVASFVADRQADGDGRAAVEGSLQELFDECNDTGDNLTARGLESHMRAVTEAALERGGQTAVRLARSLGNHLRQDGLSESHDFVYYLERALQIDEQLHGQGHPLTAVSVNDLGFAYQIAGRFGDARAFLVRALPMWEALSDEANRAATLNNLGSLARAEGSLALARRYYEEALDILERILGPSDPRTTSSLSALGILLIQQGELEKAREILERTLRIRLEALGPDDVRTAGAQVALSQLHATLGDFRAARDLYVQALPVLERRRGGSMYAMRRINFLMSIAEEGGSPSEVKQLSAQWNRMRDALLAEARPGSSTFLNNIGFEQWLRGAYGWALRTYLDALALEEQAQGPFSPGLATILNNLGMVRERTGAHAEAAAFYERALNIQQRAGLSNHPLTAKIINNYGMTLSSLGRLPEAQERLEEALALRMQLHGKEQRDTAITLANLAIVRHAQGDRVKALADVEHAVEVCRRCVGEAAPDYARCLHSLGVVNLAEGRALAGRECLEQALTIRQSSLAPDHAETADTLRVLGSLARNEGDRTGATSFLAESLRIYERRLGRDNPTCRAVRDELAAF